MEEEGLERRVGRLVKRRGGGRARARMRKGAMERDELNKKEVRKRWWTEEE